MHITHVASVLGMYGMDDMLMNHLCRCSSSKFRRLSASACAWYDVDDSLADHLFVCRRGKCSRLLEEIVAAAA